jgi:hypothetical protein
MATDRTTAINLRRFAFIAFPPQLGFSTGS